MKTIKLLFLCSILSVGMNSCFNKCVKCTDCDEEFYEFDEEICYDEVEDEDYTKKEWTEDFKEYEEETGCKCK